VALTGLLQKRKDEGMVGHSYNFLNKQQRGGNYESMAKSTRRTEHDCEPSF